MRKILIISIGILLSLNAFSQGSGGLNGYFAEIDYKGFALKDATQEVQSFIGGKAGVLFGEYFALGAAFYGSLNEIAYLEDKVYTVNFGPYEDNLDYVLMAEKLKKEVDTKYGGIVLEAFAESLNAVHISVPILIGYGISKVYNVKYDENVVPDAGFFDPPADPSELRKYEYRSYFVEKDGFHVFEPGITINFVLHDYVNLTLGASYKFIKDNTWKNVNKQHLDIQKGMNVNIGVKAVIR